ncbi:MAG: peptidase M16 [Cryomorphaceae bacterium]|nr:peptidase M16 [Cryomorphaceae bacterium]
MIEFERYTLKNGLKVLLHYDKATPMVVVNTLYDVGARDEHEDKTGFAHLFEHLMFGGSIHVKDFDQELQKAGGESNAFTSNDLTNYYVIIPANNIETALWLESDRMLSLAFTDKSLEVQRNVVIEEFKQRYLNQPYGDVWLKLRPLAYSKHPYKWATIGKDIAHIERAEMSDVKKFFKKFYCPSNAILCISGNFDSGSIKHLVEKYYGTIPGGKKPARLLPIEPTQKEFREKIIQRDVSADAFYYAFHMSERKNIGYYLADFLSDAIGKDQSSLLNIALKKEQNMVSEINAFITGSLDHGLFLITGKLSEGVDFDTLDNALWKELEKIKVEGFSDRKLNSLKNKLSTAKAFQEQGLLNKSISLCMFELLGDANGINEEMQIYNSIENSDILNFANSILKRENCSLLKVNKTK